MHVFTLNIRPPIIFVLLITTALVSTHTSLPQKSETTSNKYQWPVDTKRSLQLSSTFGESRLDHFHAGLDLPGKGLKLRPVAPGKLIYLRSSQHYPNEIPFGGGKTLLIEHEQTWSIYMHLKNIDSDLLKQSQLSADANLGTSGASGHSGGAHLHFSIYEPQKRRHINPLLVLPDKHYQDTKPPEINAFGVRLKNEFVQVKLKNEFVMTKEHPLFSEIFDRGLGRERWGIYRLKAYSGDKLAQELTFDAIVFSNGRWRTTSGLSFAEVYHNRFLNLGTGYRKAQQLKLKAVGYKGPQLTKSYDLNIRKHK